MYKRTHILFFTLLNQQLSEHLAMQGEDGWKNGWRMKRQKGKWINTEHLLYILNFGIKE